MQVDVVVQVAVLAVLGSVSVLGMLFHGSHIAFWVYLLCWCIFHSSEYYFTKTFLNRTPLFLIYGQRGSTHLMAVHAASILEYILGRRYYSRSHEIIGFCVALAGIGVRALAIKTCGESFSHYIETESTDQQLVTWGIYSWCRHPSYLGFLLFVVGMETIFGNYVSFVFCMAVLFRVFRQRIRIEEYFLVNRLHGELYVRYREKVHALVPYVW